MQSAVLHSVDAEPGCLGLNPSPAIYQPDDYHVPGALASWENMGRERALIEGGVRVPQKVDLG